MDLKEIKKQLDELSQRVDKALEENKTLHEEPQYDLDWFEDDENFYAFETIGEVSYMFKIRNTRPCLSIWSKSGDRQYLEHKKFFWEIQSAKKNAEDFYAFLLKGLIRIKEASE